MTALSNDFMPLVRYRIGDLVEACVTPYHTRYVVHGRAADAFVTRDGRPVTTLQVDQCFSGIRGVLHYQLLEGADGSWLLRFVPDGPGPVDADKSALLGRLTDVLELDAPPTLESTDALLPESSGKFRLGYPARKSPARP